MSDTSLLDAPLIRKTILQYPSILVSLTLLLAWSLPAWAFGFNEESVNWPRGKPITFQLNMANAPPSYSEEQIIEFVERAIAPWAEIETAILPLVIGPSINDSTKTSPKADKMNVIFWQSKDVPRTDFVAGKAYPFASECDIELHPRAPYTLRKVQEIIMHEMGHCLGIAHSAATGVMTKFVGLPILGQDDAVAASLRYPSRKASLKRTTATITGRIMRGSKPLIGAVLRVTDPRTNQVVVAGFSGLVDGQSRVDRSGRFDLPGIPPGRYELSIEPMDAFVTDDPSGYGSPVNAPPKSFRRQLIDIPELKAAEIRDIGKITVK